MAGTDEVGESVQAWLAEAWDPDLSLREWRELLADSGWGCPSWPVGWYGRGLPSAYEAIVAAAFNDVGAVGAPAGGGIGLAGPTLLQHGSDELKGRLLRGT